jgi:hypothetical protein
MSLARLRRSARLVAALLLLVSAVGLPHRSLDDAICSPPGAEAHDESKHVFTASAPAGHPDHCAICHWTRWLNPVLSSRVASRGPDTGVELASLATLSLRDSATDRLPARAPPSDLT